MAIPPTTIKPPTRRPLSRGVSLPIVLIFLVVISLLATVGVRRATVNETLTRNQLDFDVARQAAELALRDGERDIYISVGTRQTNALCERGAERAGGIALTPPYFDSNCSRGQCIFLLNYYEASDFDTGVNPQPWWPVNNGGLWNNDAAVKPNDAAGVDANCDFDGAVPLGTFTGAARLPAVARQPEYLIEYLPFNPDSRLFRVTARGFGTDENVEVVLQSYVAFD